MKTNLAAILIMTLPLCAARAEDVVKTFPAAGLSALAIETAGGDVSVKGTDATQIKVVLINERPERCEITMKQDGGTLRLKAETKAKSLFQRSGCEAGFRVVAPKNLSADISAGSGDVAVSDIAGDLKAKVGSGSVKGSARSKQVDVMCGSGAVELEGLVGSASVKSGSGEVHMKWARSPSEGSVDVKSGNGDVSLAFPDDMKLKTDVSTGSGSVRNEFGETASARFLVSVKAGSGDVMIGKRAKGAKG